MTWAEERKKGDIFAELGLKKIQHDGVSIDLGTRHIISVWRLPNSNQC